MHIPGMGGFLIPAVFTGLTALFAAGIKVYEYSLRFKTVKIDFIMWIAILVRVGLGLYYLFGTDQTVTERTVVIRFLITLLLVVEVLRGIRRAVSWMELDKAIERQLGNSNGH